jgi:hypothetical protein
MSADGTHERQERDVGVAKRIPLRPTPPPLRTLDPGNGPTGHIDRLCWSLWRWKFSAGGTDVFTCDVAGNLVDDATPEATGIGQATYLAATRDIGGIGIVAGSPPGIVGITLYECVDKGGRISDSGHRLLAAIPSYAEISPNERGITVIAAMRLLDEWVPLRRDAFRAYRPGEVIPVTGWHIPGTPGDAVFANVDCRRLAGEVLR